MNILPQRVYLRFSPYLLAVALTPVFLQTSTPLSCYSGDTTLSELAFIVGGEDQIDGFSPEQQNYAVALPAGTGEALVHTVSTDPEARVWVDVLVDGERLRYQQGTVGGGDTTVPLPQGSSSLEVWVRPPGGLTDFYDVAIQVGPLPQIPDIELPEGFAAYVFYDGIPGPDGIVVESNLSLSVVSEWADFVLNARIGGAYSTDDALSTMGPPFVSPDDLEAAGDQLFIADGQAQTVFKMPRSGGEPIPLATPATTGFDLFNPFGVELVPPGFDGPNVDPGDLIVADNAVGDPRRGLWAINPETGLATVFVQGDDVFVDGPLSAEFGPDGTLYVFENYDSGSSRIVTVASDGTVTPFIEEIPDRGALAVHPKNGDVYFCCGVGELCRAIHGTNAPELFASNIGRFQNMEFSPDGLSLFVGATERAQIIEIRGDEQAWGSP